ncbi:MAG: hypothetical protein ACO3B3_01605 [Cyanobium sp.]
MKTIYREIERSQALLILLITNWNHSKWSFAEFIQARALGKVIFQVVESDTPWPCPTDDGYPGKIPAPDLQFHDLLQHREAGFEQLREQLEAIALLAQGGFSWKAPEHPIRSCWPSRRKTLPSPSAGMRRSAI